MTDNGKFITELLFSTNKYGERVPAYYPDKVRHIHIDTSLRGDATGIACGCVYDYKQIHRKVSGVDVFERRPMVWVDFMLRVKPQNGEDIIFSEIRKMIYALHEMGMPIRFISADSFQSADLIQAFRSRGYESEVLSVDRPITAYENLKATIYEGRLQMYRYPIVVEELKRLEFDPKRKKIDHPPDFHKDVADALCGIVMSLSERYQVLTDTTFSFGQNNKIDAVMDMDGYLPYENDSYEY